MDIPMPEFLQVQPQLRLADASANTFLPVEFPSSNANSDCCAGEWGALFSLHVEQADSKENGEAEESLPNLPEINAAMAWVMGNQQYLPPPILAVLGAEFIGMETAGLDGEGGALPESAGTDQPSIKSAPSLPLPEEVSFESGECSAPQPAIQSSLSITRQAKVLPELFLPKQGNVVSTESLRPMEQTAPAPQAEIGLKQQADIEGAEPDVPRSAPLARSSDVPDAEGAESPKVPEHRKLFIGASVTLLPTVAEPEMKAPRIDVLSPLRPKQTADVPVATAVKPVSPLPEVAISGRLTEVSRETTPTADHEITHQSAYDSLREKDTDEPPAAAVRPGSTREEPVARTESAVRWEPMNPATSISIVRESASTAAQPPATVSAPAMAPSSPTRWAEAAKIMDPTSPATSAQPLRQITVRLSDGEMNGTVLHLSAKKEGQFDLAVRTHNTDLARELKSRLPELERGLDRIGVAAEWNPGLRTSDAQNLFNGSNPERDPNSQSQGMYERNHRQHRDKDDDQRQNGWRRSWEDEESSKRSKQ